MAIRENQAAVVLKLVSFPSTFILRSIRHQVCAMTVLSVVLEIASIQGGVGVALHSESVSLVIVPKSFVTLGKDLVFLTSLHLGCNEKTSAIALV